MKYKKWEKSEIEFIKNNASKLTDKEIAIKLSRPWASINSKRKELGIKAKFRGKYAGEKNGNWKGGKEMVKCGVCGKEIEKAIWEIKRSKFCVCSKKCFSRYVKSIKGKNHKKFIGKWKGSDGYINFYLPEHPNSKKGYIKEHRLVVEEYIGRYLIDKEVIHHINKNREDNRIENLMIFPTNSLHLKFHRKIEQFGITNPIRRQIENRWNEFPGSKSK